MKEREIQKELTQIFNSGDKSKSATITLDTHDGAPKTFNLSSDFIVALAHAWDRCWVGAYNKRGTSADLVPYRLKGVALDYITKRELAIIMETRGDYDDGEISACFEWARDGGLDLIDHKTKIDEIIKKWED